MVPGCPGTVVASDNPRVRTGYSVLIPSMLNIRISSCRPHVALATLAVVLVLSVLPALARAQTAAPSQSLDRPLRVFIDCRGPGCDQEFFRRELAWVDHVRDQKDADVHILVTARGTGGGGTEYTLRFIGQGRWDGQEDTFLRAAEAGESDDGRRRQLTQTFGLGLARFAAATPVGTQLRVTPPQASTARLVQTTAADDPWNFWVFRTNINVNLNGEASSDFKNISANESANRTTDAWKFNINAGTNYSESRFDLSDGESFVSTRRGWNVNGLVVKSLTEHWSLGGKAGASGSTFLNQHLAARIAPGIEYDVFPYSQSTARSLTLQWTAGLDHYVYDQVTIYDKTEETKWDETFLAQLGLRQPFGSVGLSVEVAHYFDDPSLNRFGFNADTEFRISRGLSLRLDGNYQLVHDQLYLKRGEASNEEIIARQQQLATSYRYSVSVGVTYRFGSINNNVVNPRF